MNHFKRPSRKPFFIIGLLGLAFWGAVVFGIGYLVFHPELIGEFFGRVVEGFQGTQQ